MLNAILVFVELVSFLFIDFILAIEAVQNCVLVIPFIAGLLLLAMLSRSSNKGIRTFPSLELIIRTFCWNMTSILSVLIHPK